MAGDGGVNYANRPTCKTASSRVPAKVQSEAVSASPGVLTWQWLNTRRRILGHEDKNVAPGQTTAVAAVETAAPLARRVAGLADRR